ncbi:MAG: hypothetical protein ONB46_06955 [candidate division KSB1 bacterium]|nr:hypothetical protein [candidate division KSB1 bacterium]MDZ7367157.1 hypothetical protein [candidate division KSB1 bacterium]
MTAKQKQTPAGASQTTLGPSFFGALALALACSILLWASAIIFYLGANPRP